MRQDPDRATISFRIGDALPADSRVAQFVAITAMALNDQILLTRLYKELDEEGRLDHGETWYLVRAIASHAYEYSDAAREFVKDRAVAELLDATDRFAAPHLPADEETPSQHLDAILALTDPKRSSEAVIIVHLRNHGAMHYPTKNLAKAMREAEDQTGEILVGENLASTRLRFADVIQLQFVSQPKRETSEDEPALFRRLVQYQAALVGHMASFGQALVAAYIDGLPPHTVDRT